MINPLKQVEINHFVLRHPSVDARTRGMRVAHITDIHLGRWVKPRHVREIASYVNAAEPDLTVLTGDYVGYNRKDIDPCAEALAHLQGPTYATLGNHDHWACTETSLNAFERVGIPVLSNRSVSVRTARGHDLRLVGVDDAVTRRHDVDMAFEEIGGDEGFRLVLCHVPELGPSVARAGGHMMLSGHTHGLQFNIPRVTRNLAARFGMKYIQGAYAFDGCMLYVSRGLGSASWPWRIRAAPEMAFFTLQPGPRPELILEHRLTTGILHNARRRGRKKARPKMLEGAERGT